MRLLVMKVVDMDTVNADRGDFEGSSMFVELPRVWEANLLVRIDLLRWTRAYTSRSCTARFPQVVYVM